MTLDPFAQFAALLCTELGCISVLCLRAAREATKLIRLPPGGWDDSLMTLVDTNLYTHQHGHKGIQIEANTHSMVIQKEENVRCLSYKVMIGTRGNQQQV